MRLEGSLWWRDRCVDDCSVAVLRVRARHLPMRATGKRIRLAWPAAWPTSWNWQRPCIIPLPPDREVEVLRSCRAFWTSPTKPTDGSSADSERRRRPVARLAWSPVSSLRPTDHSMHTLGRHARGRWPCPAYAEATGAVLARAAVCFVAGSPTDAARHLTPAESLDPSTSSC